MKVYAVKIFDISNEKLDDLLLLIDSEKRYKINKFINKKDKIRTLIGDILIRTLIVEELSISNEFIKFEKNQYGKPFLSDYPNINFNISHSGEYVVCAIDSEPIGIDVEEIKHIRYKELAKSFFTETELNYIINQNSDSQLSKFYEIWTLKESYIKCCGLGLSIPLNSFSIDIDRYENIKVFNNNKYSEHIFKKFDIELGYKIAVCSLNKCISNRIMIIKQNRLINDYFNLFRE